MLLENQVALVTGAASGIGRASAQLFAREGAKVVVADIRETKSLATVESIRVALAWNLCSHGMDHDTAGCTSET